MEARAQSIPREVTHPLIGEPGYSKTVLTTLWTKVQSLTPQLPCTFPARTAHDVIDERYTVIISPGKHRPQGPWDPNEKKKYFDTREAWLWLPLLALVGAVIAALYFLG